MKKNKFLRYIFYTAINVKDSFFAFLVRLDNSRRIANYFAKHGVKKLHLGAGGNLLQSWLNTDINPDLKTGVFLDATKKFPFENNSFDYIFSEHMIEHLKLQDGIKLLNECFRVLKPKGKLRISTPDLKYLIELYNPQKSQIQEKEIKRIVDMVFGDIKIYHDSFVINNFFRSWGHKFIYDCKLMQELLKRSGFVDIKQCQVGESGDQNLQKLEAHGKFISEEINKLQTFVIEAVKK